SVSGGPADTSASSPAGDPQPAAVRTAAVTKIIAVLMGVSTGDAYASAPFRFALLRGELGPRPGAEADAVGRHGGRDVAPVGTVPERRHVHGDRVTDLDHVVAVARAIHVVGAVALELDVAFPFRVLHAQHELHVGVDRLEGLDDTGDRHGFREVEL